MSTQESRENMTTLANINIALSNFSTTEDGNYYDYVNDDDLSLLPMPWLVVAVVLISIAIVTAVGGSLLVILSYRRDWGLRDVHNLYLLHLAVCDLMIGACSMPFYLIYTVLYWTWPFGATMCKLFLIVDDTVCCMSTLVVILVAADRRALLTRGANYQAVETRKRANIKLTICWICAFLLYSPAVLFWDVVRGYPIVAADDCDVEYVDNVFYVVITESISFFVPFIFLTVFNMHVFMKLKKRLKTSHTSSSASSLQYSGSTTSTLAGSVRDVSNSLGKFSRKIKIKMIKNKNKIDRKSKTSLEVLTPSELSRKIKIKVIQSTSKNDCEPVTSLEVLTPSEMLNNSSRDKAQATLLPQATLLNDQATQELSDSQTTVCSSQLQDPESSQSAESNFQSQTAAHSQDAAVSPIVPAEECDTEYDDNLFYVVMSFFVPFIFLTVLNRHVFMELTKRWKSSHTSESTHSLQYSEGSALTFEGEQGIVRDISNSSCELSREMKIKAIQNTSENDCESVTALEVLTPSEVLNSSSGDKAQATLLTQATPLNDQAWQELSHSQTTVCSSQLQDPASSQSAGSSFPTRKAARFQDAAVPPSELQTGSLCGPAKSTSRAEISLIQSSARPSSVVSAPVHKTSWVRLGLKLRQAKDKREKRVAVILTGLVVALVIFWLPYSLTAILSAVCEDCVNEDLYEVFVWLLWIKSCVNPFLYAYNSPRFRRNFQELLHPILPARLQATKCKLTVPESAKTTMNSS